eukprot:1378955-Amorphochlora_amoeboformis.AAC.1
MLPDGNGDDLSLHSGMHVEAGEKWGANLWVWDPLMSGARRLIDHGASSPHWQRASRVSTRSRLARVYEIFSQYLVYKGVSKITYGRVSVKVNGD